jgi:DNA-binding NarL/FixJ family response regulator
MPLLILVVDDDPGIRLATSDYLEMAGYSTLTAENGFEALAVVEKFQPHLIVTDIAMPRMDGYEFVRQVRQNPAFRLLPVIFLTAHTATEERIRGYQTGCDVYLAKPFNLEELGAIVRNLLDRAQIIEAEWRFRMASTPASLPKASEGELETAHSHTQPATAIALKLNLTSRELEVLALISAGFSNVQIGDQLHLSPRTVEKYVSSLLRKTETSNRAELVRFAMEHRLVE